MENLIHTGATWYNIVKYLIKWSDRHWPGRDRHPVRQGPSHSPGQQQRETMGTMALRAALALLSLALGAGASVPPVRIMPFGDSITVFDCR